MQETIEFTTIQSLVALLEAELEKYTKNEFSQFPQVKDLTSDTLLNAIAELITTPDAQNSLAPKGVIRSTAGTMFNWGHKATAVVKITNSPIKYHRLPHLLYFAEKTREIKDLIKKLLGYAQLNPLSFSAQIEKVICETGAALNASLDELLKTTKILAETYYDVPVTVTANNETREIAGMKGSLSKALNQIITDKYAAHSEHLKTEITRKTQLLIQNKTSDKNQTLDAAASNTYAAIQKQLPVSENSAFQTAILKNDLATVELCIKDHDVNAVNKQGFSPLYLAIFDDRFPYRIRDDLNIAIVKLLLENKANPNENFGEICRCSFLHAVIFQRVNSNKYPYEIRGAKKVNMELVKLLVSHGAKLDAIPSDEPQYDKSIPQPNIPGIIADKSNKTPLALYLRSVKQAPNDNHQQPPIMDAVKDNGYPPLLEMK